MKQPLGFRHVVYFALNSGSSKVCDFHLFKMKPKMEFTIIEEEISLIVKWLY